MAAAAKLKLLFLVAIGASVLALQWRMKQILAMTYGGAGTGEITRSAAVEIIRQQQLDAVDAAVDEEKRRMSHSSFVWRNASSSKELCEMSKTNFRECSGLFVVVTGCERSGTTLISKLMMSAPNLFSGFECGMLLSETPRKYDKTKPFYGWTNRDWKLTPAESKFLLTSSCHAEMYRRLRRQSPLFRSSNGDSLILDKTPKYIYDLDKVMDRSPGVPVIVTYKDRHVQIESWSKRADISNSNSDLEFLNKRYDRAEAGLNRALAKYPDRIHVLNVTALYYEDPNKVMSDAYRFLGMTWKSEYFSMSAFNAKAIAVGQTPLLPFDPDAPKNRYGTKVFEKG